MFFIRHKAHVKGCFGRRRNQIFLGIETSCDDTAVAVLTSNRQILADVRKSQDEIHKQVKGITPHLAREAHKDNIESALSEAMAKANIQYSDLTAVAVTTGPGLGICLGVGLAKAQELCRLHSKPLISVNHMEGHALVVRQASPDVKFPFLTLLISGGHTMILVCKGVGNYVQLGTSLDDSIGEAYDKVARVLDLEWNGGGGRSLEKLALEGSVQPSFPFVEPMIGLKNCDFSFSGLKTSIFRELDRLKEEKGEIDSQTKADIAATFQHLAIKHLTTRLSRAIGWCKDNVEDKIDTLVVSGGVASNRAIYSKLEDLTKRNGYKLFVPPPSLCTDNGVMIAWAGIENFLIGKSTFDPAEAQSLRYEPKWPLDPSGVQYFPLGAKALHKLKKNGQNK